MEAETLCQAKSKNGPKKLEPSKLLRFFYLTSGKRMQNWKEYEPKLVISRHLSTRVTPLDTPSPFLNLQVLNSTFRTDNLKYPKFHHKPTYWVHPLVSEMWKMKKISHVEKKKLFSVEFQMASESLTSSEAVPKFWDNLIENKSRNRWLKISNFCRPLRTFKVFQKIAFLKSPNFDTWKGFKTLETTPKNPPHVKRAKSKNPRRRNYFENTEIII